MEAPEGLRLHEPLAAHTTLEVGGPARFWAEAGDTNRWLRLARWAAGEGLAIAVLGGGSNTLVSDRGFDGLVIHPTLAEWRWWEEGGALWVEVGAGRPWDDLVRASVDRGASGLAALSGIPGLVGAAPIQNIGAYGLELAEVLHSVEVLDLRTGATSVVPKERCGFGYRWSRWKGAPLREVILSLTLRVPWETPPPRYAELAARLSATTESSATTVRGAVLDLRRAKSMVLAPEDENRRSAGSFFLNPTVEDTQLGEIVAAFPTGREMPCWPQDRGRTKLSAAWLIERCGFGRGFGSGRAGLSTRHTLAVINRGGATAAEIVDLAGTVQRGVAARTGLWLEPEVQRLGFDPDPFGNRAAA